MLNPRISIIRMTSTVRLCLVMFSAALFTEAQAADPSTARPPNIIVVLVDDLGYGDLGCYGHPTIHSPNIDRFAAESLRFTNCYSAAPNCSPSRTGLMTGRTPHRVGIHNWIPYDSPMHVRREEITVATLLRNAGYATCHVGKWHLNGRLTRDDQPQPNDHGFDHWFATQNNALPSHRNPDNFVRNGQPVGPLRGFAAQLVVDEANHWLSELRDLAKPFFLFVCFHEPHEPIETSERFRQLYSDSDEPTLREHHGNISQMDEAFGRLLARLDDMEERDNTFVLFTSDNGPAITRQHPHGSSGPLRAKKGHVYDGGIRVPGIVRWPGHTQAGTTSDQPISGVDVLPTLCALANCRLPEDRILDGVNMLPTLAGRPLERSKPLYWHFNRASSTPKVAIRVGDWKLLAHLDGPNLKPGGDLVAADLQAIREAELTKFELYRIGQDIGETTDLADIDQQRLETLKNVIKPLYREVRDASPTWPEWVWPRFEGKRIRAYQNARRQAAEER